MTEKIRDDEIDLLALFTVLWTARMMIGCVSICSAAIAMVYALSLPNIYQSSALMSPAEQSNDGLGGILSRYGGLASMAGVTLPGADRVSKAELAIEVIKSRAFAGEFIDKHDVLPELLAVDHWDSQARQLVIDRSQYDVRSARWIRKVSAPKSTIPSKQEAFEALKEVLEVNQDQNTNMVSISVKHESPDVAKQWVDWIVEDINETIRRKEIQEAAESIEYLKRQAAGNSIADLDQVFFELMQAQMQSMMLAQVRREYVLTTIDPAISSETKSEPNRILIIIFGFLIGFILGLIASLGEHYAKRV